MLHDKIACPKCDWEPRRESRWQCTCGHVWNTFDTAACCPACHRQWEDTCCLACHRWSKHLDWYRGLDDDVLELIKAVPEPAGEGI